MIAPPTIAPRIDAADAEAVQHAAVGGVDADVAQERLRHAEHHDVADPVEEQERQHQRRLRLRQEGPVRLAERARLRDAAGVRRRASGGAAPAGAASRTRFDRRRQQHQDAGGAEPHCQLVSRGQHDQHRRADDRRDPEGARCACPRTAPGPSGRAPAGRSRRRRCRAWRAGSPATARPTQNGRRLPLGAIAATTNIPTPRMICITQTQVRLRPNRSTIGLQRNLSVTARWSADVIADLRVRGADRGQELQRHLVQEAPGQPLAEVRRRRPEEVLLRLRASPPGSPPSNDGRAVGRGAASFFRGCARVGGARARAARRTR